MAWLIILIVLLAALALFSYRAVRWLRRDMAKPTFLSCGFEYARCGPYEGWLNRDPQNGDWIIWCVKQKATFRGSNSDALRWLRSPEAEDECMQLGRLYSSQQKKRRPRRVLFLPKSDAARQMKRVG